jgi:3-isopropylmalate dehydrogenase
MILSAAMMLKFSFGLEKEAAAVERAVEKVLDQGLRTRDIVNLGSKSSKGPKEANEKTVGTRAMGDAVLKALDEDISISQN